MKIFEIIPDLSSGGAERFVTNLCNEFVKDKSIDLTQISYYRLIPIY